MHGAPKEWDEETEREVEDDTAKRIAEWLRANEDRRFSGDMVKSEYENIADAIERGDWRKP
jgi:disulfide oxidoreductase YuzD